MNPILSTIPSNHHNFNCISISMTCTLQEREADVAALAERLSVLQEEITSGAPTERKIFELAKAQAQREHTHNIKVDTRELAFQKLQVRE